ncbi:hypothetical protein [Actinophytocola oryzae]|nr:hypothetical protein [Actinophytocola oryzae]
MVCRTLTSTIRLLETHQLFRDDVRLRFLFAVDEGSRFGATAERLLRLAGAPDIVGWGDVRGLRPDLTLAASENVDMAALGGDVIVLPHGVGFNKFVPTRDGAGVRVAGVPDAASLRTGRLRLTLAHPSQDTQLRALCADVVGHTVVTGDPTLDQLAASLPLRDRYRELLHAGTARTVLVSSTWGSESSVGRWWTLPTDLLAALPSDEYRVCLALHPNVWARYGSLGVENYLAGALDAGLVLLPPEAGWHAALVASHVVIADHGSLALYAAALGKPLLVTGNATEVVPGTPVADLVATARHLDRHAPLAPQVERARTDESLRLVADRAFAHRGEAVSRLQRELYRALDLEPHSDHGLHRVADPVVTRRGPWSFRTAASTDGDTTVLVRYPAAAKPRSAGHLVVTDDETDLRLHERAAVVCRDRVIDRDLARGWAHNALDTHPGARLAVVAVPGGCLVAVRGGTEFLVDAGGAVDVPALGSFCYERLLAGELGPGERTLSVGGRRFAVRVTPVRGR